MLHLSTLTLYQYKDQDEQKYKLIIAEYINKIVTKMSNIKRKCSAD